MRTLRHLRRLPRPLLPPGRGAGPANQRQPPGGIPGPATGPAAPRRHPGSGPLVAPARRTISPAAVIEPRPRHRPDPLIEPRPRIRPTPRFEPRPVIHPTPRLEAALNDAAARAPAPPEACPPAAPSRPSRRRGKSCRRTAVPAPRPLLKINTRRLDTLNKGSLVDIFM